MATSLPASIADFVLGLTLGSTAQDAGNRFSVDGLTLGKQQDGALDIGIQKFEAASIRLAIGALGLDVGNLALHKLTAQVRFDDGQPRLSTLEAASAELSGVKLHGSLDPSRPAQAPAGSWNLGPLAAANGSIRAQIVDAHLLFDADVTVPIRQGEVNFNDATVEHVGPDSRMGISRLGLYVDAPNGRSYLYQFAAAPVSGVEYERHDSLLGRRVSDRGKLQLQPFGEALLLQARGGPGVGFTEQARLLLDRTSVSGDVRLSDGKFAGPGVQAELVGRADGRNVVRLRSESVGRGLTVEMASLSVRNAVLNAGDMQLACAEMTAALVARFFVEGTQLRFEFDLENTKISGLRLQP
jgi:hypothetical protein